MSQHVLIATQQAVVQFLLFVAQQLLEPLCHRLPSDVQVEEQLKLHQGLHQQGIYTMVAH